MRPLLVVLLLAGLLLAGRAASSFHDYAHDLALGDTECEVCELGHVFKNDVVPARATSPETAVEVLSAPSALDTVRVFPSTPYRSRAPPSISV